MVVCSKERNGVKTPFGCHGKLHVQGASLMDESGKKCQLRGISTHNLSNYPEYVNKEAFQQLADEWKIGVVRLAMYSDLADEYHGYSDGDDAHREELEALVLKGVQIAAELGIYVIVDWHILFDYDPNMHTDMAIHFFKTMCPRLAAYDNVIYEICNEPNLQTTWDEIKNYAQSVIPVIRAVEPEKIIIVGTPVWSQDVDVAAKTPLPYNNLVYALHFYADTHRDNLREKMLTAIKEGLPVFVSEFGVCDASGNGPMNEEQTEIWLKLLNENNVSYVIWNLSNKAETSAFIHTSCTKSSAWTKEDLSDCGKKVVDYMTL